MQKSKRLIEFEKLVENKFNVFNSLFLNLPFPKISNTGILIPLLHQQTSEGLAAHRSPSEILGDFFSHHAQLDSEQGQIDFMFRVVQYVERQVVLYDSVEDAAFPRVQELSETLNFRDFMRLHDNPTDEAKIALKLQDFSARVVFTAHPTQFYPPAVLDIIERLRDLIEQNDINGIDLHLQQLGLTSFINSQKPTPLDEARNIIYFLRNVFYNEMGRMYSDIKAFGANQFIDNSDLIRLGFWPGGDRDGNPFVTADITRQVADELRMTLMKCYYQDMKLLERKLTFKGVEELIADLRAKLYKAMFDPEVIVPSAFLRQQLEEARRKLMLDYNGLFKEELDLVLTKVTMFRDHFATLDIRQDHSVHSEVVREILIAKGKIKSEVDELDSKELVACLFDDNWAIEPDVCKSDLTRDTLHNIRNLAAIQKKNGESGCNRYIISNSEDVFSVLYVLAMFKWSGYADEEIAFDIVPLFESMQAMEHCEEIMEGLFANPNYRAHLTRRENIQTIMLGFSDGTKDGGYLKANWSIFKTKERLSALCAAHGVETIFFDGRGGPPARGGGKTHSFYAAQSGKISNKEIQLTIQGQTITSMYGTCEQFRHNMEQLLTAGLSQNFNGDRNDLNTHQRELMEQLAEISFKKYGDLKAHPKFLPYLENRSTLQYYSEANIGSRPAKRGKSKKLELKDLRAISFVGCWSQAKQNVPGYFGLGTALKTLEKEQGLPNLKALYNEVPYFKALVHNSMMSLSKTNFDLTRYMEKDPEYGEFWKVLFAEYELSKQMLLAIAGYEVLMQEEPVSKKSIEIRERIVLPLLLIQQYALQQVERNNTHRDAYHRLVSRTLYGNINASRNSV